MEIIIFFKGDKCTRFSLINVCLVRAALACCLAHNLHYVNYDNRAGERREDARGT